MSKVLIKIVKIVLVILLVINNLFWMLFNSSSHIVPSKTQSIFILSNVIIIGLLLIIFLSKRKNYEKNSL